MLTRAEKQEQVDLLRERMLRANSVLAVDYRGLTVAESTDLRRRLRALGEGEVEYRVAKNSLLRRATADSGMAPLEAVLTGPTAVAFAFEEPSAVARVLVDFAKDNEKLDIKGGVVDGELMDAGAIERLAALPTGQELRGMLAGTLQAPLRNLSGTLYALLGNLRNALERRGEQLET